MDRELRDLSGVPGKLPVALSERAAAGVITKGQGE